jgi:predicted NBD/HSP70 family sugar kinase
MIAKKYIVFDIGATKILKSVVKLQGNKFALLEIEEEQNPRREAKIQDIILAYCQKYRKVYWTKKVALSAASIVDPKRKTVSGGKACYGTINFDFSFLERNGFSVRVENDGRCFALGEYFFGKGKDAESLFSMTLGTNIGGGFISKDFNFQGAHHSAMEISFLNLFFENKWQDWDDFCAGEGIERSYKKATGIFLSAKDIFLLAKKNNKEAKEAVSLATSVLGIGIANMLNILDPEVIVFGGSISKQKEYVKKAILIAQKKVMNRKAKYRFAISSLGNKANLLGAALLYK